MTEYKVTQFYLSDWAIVQRLKELVIEYEQLKSYWDDRRKGRGEMDYETKCTACGEGFPKLHACEIAGTIMERHECSNVLCGRRTATYTRDSGKSRKEWCWLQSMCDEVTAPCVTEIAAAVPDGEVADGFGSNTTAGEEIRILGRGNLSNQWHVDTLTDTTSHAQIVLRTIEPAPLTGKAWAAKQVPGTVFDIDGVVGMFYFSSHLRIAHHPVDLNYPSIPALKSDGIWSMWDSRFDNVSDAHIIHRPKGGE